MIDVPTVTPSGAIIGLCEVEGKARTLILPDGSRSPKWISPIAGHECVWFEVLLERYKSSEKSGSWVTEKYYSSGAFSIADEYGFVIVNPEHADTSFLLSCENSSGDDYINRATYYFGPYKDNDAAKRSQQWTPSPDGYYKWHPIVSKWIAAQDISPDFTMFYDRDKSEWMALPPADNSYATKAQVPGWIGNIQETLGDVANAIEDFSPDKRRITESVVYEDQTIYTHGTVTISESGTDLVMGEGRDSSGLIISKDDESKELKKLKLARNIHWLIIFIGLSILCAYLSFSHFESTQSIVLTYVAFIIFGILFLTFLKFLNVYNRFVRLKQQVALSRSAIDVTLTRRTNLIPDLNDIVSLAAGHIVEVQTRVAELRSQKFENYAPEFLALAEQYAEISSQQNFLQLQRELARTEEKIAMARSFTNDSILAMDNLRATIFGMVISPLFAKEAR